MDEEPTSAELGYGAYIDISTDNGSTWASAGQISGDITPPSATVDTHDASHSQSPGRVKEFITGFSDPGNCAYPIHFNPNSPVDQLYRSIRLAGARVLVRLTYGNGVSETFAALLTGYQPTVPINGRQTAQVEWKVTGMSEIA